MARTVGPRRRCRSCGGRYFIESPPGQLYYHACAPVGTDGDGDPIEHPRKRDENIVVDDQGKRRGIKHEGDGADDD